ncbi:MAG: hypothetical protein H0V12_13015 [Chloroflexi bacterium]|nr:hypothetical protein [Chloroflexota bacterium]
MAEVTSYTTGQPNWADVTTPDADAAARFYSELFGWGRRREGVGRFAVVADPWGAVFQVVK